MKEIVGIKIVLLALGVLMSGICRAETIIGEPDAYLDYIEANGSQYIDTGVNAETGLKARADLAWGDAVAADGGSGAGYADDYHYDVLVDARTLDKFVWIQFFTAFQARCLKARPEF